MQTKTSLSLPGRRQFLLKGLPVFGMCCLGGLNTLSIAKPAADIGYATHCHVDYASATAFNPKIRMYRTKTLMEGHEYCDHKWIWEG